MKLRLDGTEKKRNYIAAVEADYVRIREDIYRQSLIIGSDSLDLWPVTDVDTISDSALEVLIVQQPEIIVLGTGRHHRFPPLDKMKTLMESGIGYEIMSTAAACRTYNVLLAEDRNVVAGLIID